MPRKTSPTLQRLRNTVMFGRLVSEIEFLMGSEGRDLDEWETWTPTALVQVGIRGDL